MGLTLNSWFASKEDKADDGGDDVHDILTKTRNIIQIYIHWVFWIRKTMRMNRIVKRQTTVLMGLADV